MHAVLDWLTSSQKQLYQLECRAQGMVNFPLVFHLFKSAPFLFRLLSEVSYIFSDCLLVAYIPSKALSIYIFF